jgi:ribonuclease P protein component
MTAYAVAGERDESWRFGFIVSKAVGNAVVRNRVRRRLKAISSTVDRVGSGQSTVDIVFRAHPAAASATFSELHDDVISLVSRVSAPGSAPGRKA